MHNPHMSDIPMNKEVTYFARTNFRGSNEMFGIKRKDRRQHMYILGKSGTGKSALMSNLIIQNVWNGEGLCLVDPHGELVETVLKTIPEHRIKDVVYFNPADTEFCIGFNPLELHDPKYKHLVASGLMGIFTKIWANVWSPRMEYILNNTILALLDTPGSTLMGITRMLVDKDYRQVIVSNLKDPMVKAFWVHEFEQWKEQFRNEAISPIQNKVGQFLSSSIIRNIVGQQQSTIDIFEMMNQGKIFLVNVSKGRIGEDNSALLGAMIITKIQLAVMERVRIPEEERRDFYLYVDEFQNFATDSFASILSEARKYRLCLTLAHQYTAQIEGGDDDLKDAVFGNVGSMIIFRVGADDAKTLEKEFAPEFTPEDFVGLPNYQIYLKLMIDGITSRPFSANTLPPIKIDHGSDTTQKVIEESRKQFCKPQSQVESAIMSWSSTAGGTTMKQTVNKTTGQTVEMYNAICLNCNKEISVPFEPKAGKPIYCKECLNKIKVGELKPAKGFYDKNQTDGPKPAEALAAIGIEYEPSLVSTNFKKQNKIKEIKQNTNKQTTKDIDIKKEKNINFTKDKSDDFVSLKELLTKIKPSSNNSEIVNKKESIANKINPDPKKITLHPILKENTIIKKSEPEKPKKPEILKPKAASFDSQQKFKSLINNVQVPNTKIENKVFFENLKESITEDKNIAENTQTKNENIPNNNLGDILNTQTTEEKNQSNIQKEQFKKDEDTQHFVPKPPESYQKRTPQKEVPEEILREIFTEDNQT